MKIKKFFDMELFHEEAEYDPMDTKEDSMEHSDNNEGDADSLLNGGNDDEDVDDHTNDGKISNNMNDIVLEKDDDVIDDMENLKSSKFPIIKLSDLNTALNSENVEVIFEGSIIPNL